MSGRYAAGREFLRDRLRLAFDFRQTDQSRGVPAPPLQKPLRQGQESLPLPDWQSSGEIPEVGLAEAIRRRCSRRDFRAESLSKVELSFLLWATQGVRGRPASGHAFRVVPSAGCRHAFETYVAALNVNGLVPALYRYLPLNHALVQERQSASLGPELSQAALGQEFVASAAATFIWSCIPYRMEWRYGRAAHRVIAIDAGHVCQNLYLGAEAVGAGTCAVAAFHQERMDRLLEVDGEEEFALYLAPVGKVAG